MDIEQLEKLNTLKEKGLLTQEEFDVQKKILLQNTQETSKVEKVKFGLVKKIFGGIGTFVFICIICLFFAEDVNFACDETTMQEAQDLINESFPNWHGALRLNNPVTVEQSENHLKCRANSNLKDFPTMSYELDKQPNGEILIQANPVSDAIDAAFSGFNFNDD